MMRAARMTPLVCIFASVLAVVLLVRWNQARGPKQPAPAAVQQAPQVVEPSRAEAAPAPIPSMRSARVEALRAPALAQAEAQQSDAESMKPGAPSHPIGEERQRLQRELRLLSALNDALDMQDVDRMRDLIATYRAIEPEDVHRLQEGYEILADCLASDSQTSHTNAQRYYDEARASTLRRYVRRFCLERI